MKWHVIGIAAIVMCSMLTAASADLITIDGNDADWIANAADWVEHDDVNGDVATPGDPPTYLPGYDIDYSYFLWDHQALRPTFMLRTIDPTLHTYDADVIEILINADDDPGTGGHYHEMQGADYRILWNFDGSANTAFDLGDVTGDPATPVMFFQQWTGLPDWGAVAGLSDDDVVIAWGTIGTEYSVVEASVNPAIFGDPDDFTWGFYLDNGGTASDDASPNSMDQRGYTPEPTTLALLPLGLAGLAAWRRRRDA